MLVFFCIRLWECVYKQINSVIYFGQKKGGGRWNGMEMEMGKGRLFFE